MAFLGGLLGNGLQAQAPGTAQQPQGVGGLLGSFGDQFNQVRSQNPEALLALASGLLNGNVGQGVAGMADATANYNQDQRRAALQREGWAHDDQQFDKSFGLQQQEFGLKKDELASNAQEKRALNNMTADFLEKNGADTSLVQAARAGQGAAAFKMYQDLKGGNTEYGVTPAYGVDANGNTVPMMFGKNGTIRIPEVPGGVTPLSPEGLNQQKAFGTATGKAQGEAGSSLPVAEATAQTVSQQISDLKSDPYLPSMVGAVDGRLPNFSSNAARVQSKLDQLQGGAFLQARQLLKGGGAITDFEGKKAEAAMVRLNTAQSEKDFNDALDDFNDAVQQGVTKLQAQTGGRTAAPPASSGNKSSTGVSWSVEP